MNEKKMKKRQTKRQGANWGRCLKQRSARQRQGPQRLKTWDGREDGLRCAMPRREGKAWELRSKSQDRGDPGTNPCPPDLDDTSSVARWAPLAKLHVARGKCVLSVMGWGALQNDGHSRGQSCLIKREGPGEMGGEGKALPTDGRERSRFPAGRDPARKEGAVPVWSYQGKSADRPWVSVDIRLRGRCGRQGGRAGKEGLAGAITGTGEREKKERKE